MYSIRTPPKYPEFERTTASRLDTGHSPAKTVFVTDADTALPITSVSHRMFRKLGKTLIHRAKSQVDILLPACTAHSDPVPHSYPAHLPAPRSAFRDFYMLQLDQFSWPDVKEFIMFVFTHLCEIPVPKARNLVRNIAWKWNGTQLRYATFNQVREIFEEEDKSYAALLYLWKAKTYGADQGCVVTEENFYLENIGSLKDEVSCITEEHIEKRKKKNIFDFFEG